MILLGPRGATPCISTSRSRGGAAGSSLPPTDSTNLATPDFRAGGGCFSGRTGQTGHRKHCGSTRLTHRGGPRGAGGEKSEADRLTVRDRHTRFSLREKSSAK